MVYGEPVSNNLSISYRVIAAADVPSTVEMALREHLYMDNWSLQGLYREILTLPNHFTHVNVVVAYDGDQAIGICLATVDKPRPYPPIKSKDWAGMNFFVQPAYRRKGIGTQLLTHYKEAFGLYHAISGTGIDGSKEFFRKNTLSYIDLDLVSYPEARERIHLFPHFRSLKKASD